MSIEFIFISKIFSGVSIETELSFSDPIMNNSIYMRIN